MIKDISIIDEDVEYVYGIKKLAQHFIIELLTELGSVKYLPNKGCRFLKYIKSATTEFDVFSAFNAVKHRIKNNLVKFGYVDALINKIIIEDGITIVFIVKSKSKQIEIETPKLK